MSADISNTFAVFVARVMHVSRKTIFFTILSFLLAITVTILAIPRFIDFSIYRGPLALILTQALNRDTQINGNLRAKPGFSPTVIVEDVKIANPRSGRSPFFAHIKKLEITFSTLGLLQGQFNIKSVAIDHSAIHLERYNDGSNNWSFGGGDTSLFVTTFKRLALNNADINYYSDIYETQSFRVARSQLTYENDGGYALLLAGVYKDRLLELELTTPEWPDFPNKPLAFRASADIEKNSISVDLRVASDKGRLSIDGGIDINRIYMDEITKLIPVNDESTTFDNNTPLPIDQIFRDNINANVVFNIGRGEWKKHRVSQLTSRVIYGADAFQINRLSATLDGAPVTANLRAYRKNEQLQLNGNVGLSWLDLADLTDHKITGTAMAPYAAFATYGNTLDELVAHHSLYGQLSRSSFQFESNIVNQVAISNVHISHSQVSGLTVIAEGQYNSLPFIGSANLSSLASYARNYTPVDLSASVKIGDSLISTVTRLYPLLNSKRQFSIALSGKQLKELEPVFGVTLADVIDYKAFTLLRIDKNTIDFSDTVIQTAASHIDGNLRYQWYDVNVPAWRLRVKNSRLNLGEVRKIIASFRKPSDSTPTAGNQNKPNDRFIPDIELRTLTNVSVMVDAKIEHTQLVDDDIPLDNANFSLLMTPQHIEGSLNADRFFRGQLHANLLLASTSETTASQVDIDLRDLDYGYLLKKLNVTEKMSGRANFKMNFAGVGTTAKSLLKNATGTIQITGGQGVIANRYLRLWGDDIAQQLLSAEIMREEHAKLECVVGRLRLDQGVLKSDALLLDTDRITIAGSGGADLVSEQLEFIISPEPKNPSLLSLATPIRVKGTLAHPTASPHKLATLWTVGSIVAGVANPAILLARFAKIGNIGENACLDAVGVPQNISADKQMLRQVKTIVNFIQNPFEKLPDIDIPENVVPNIPMNPLVILKPLTDIDVGSITQQIFTRPKKEQSRRGKDTVD